MPPLTSSSKTLGPDQRERNIQLANDRIKHNIDCLNDRWDLRIPSPQAEDSPSKRGQSKEQACCTLVKQICYKGSINQVRAIFDEQAEDLYRTWVKKPNANGDVLPKATRDRPRPVTVELRLQLLDLFYDVLQEQRNSILKTPSSQRHAVSQQVDDTPIPSLLPKRASSTDSKRPREDFKDVSSVKKVRPNPLETMMPSSSMPPPKIPSFGPVSANTSFTSVVSASNTASVFSTRPGSFIFNSQSTAPDELENRLPEKETREQFTTTRQSEKADSSDYASSSFERKLAELSESEILGRPTHQNSDPQVNEELSQGLDVIGLADTSPEFTLKEKLSKVFPKLPASLRYASIRSIYEINRVFLHAKVSMEGIAFPSVSELDDYSKLWNFLENIPVLEEKLPQKCAIDVWNSAKDTFIRGFHGIHFSGSLRFDSDSVFSLKLDPMRWDRTHRLGRRFGMDRFLEIDIPHLTGSSVPKQNELADRDRDIIENWLIDPRTRAAAGHSLLGRLWKPFFQKPKERRDKRQESTRAADDGPEAANRIYFFAMDGFQAQPPMGIQQLLDSFRSTELNRHQPFLKLFARTALVLSRNSATVILDESQINYIPDIMSELDEQNPTKKAEEMTDGAGRISYSLALKIGQILALPDSPSGFQARIGNAKGFWSVDYSESRPGDWIDICESQCKWVRGPEVSHPANRTFEVLRFSGPLKPADLNLQFLPVLMDRAKSEQQMRTTLSCLLESGLDEKLRVLRLAMEDPQTFRQWLRESNTNIDDRVRHGVVPYRAGLPISTDEKLNLLLDAGFSADTLQYAKELALTAFENKCLDLQRRLNITVARSCYAYMIPDFTGTLEPDEVHFDFSRFHDSITGASSVLLRNIDLLVARSPSHFPSDIQKVRAVLKEKLIGVKDVIVFSTKGKTSLASKLSGGDYDGDIAWVCWEASIVDNFQNADVPEIPDLVAEGLIKKNKMTYDDLVKDQEDPASAFLKDAFRFNMEQNMLGICTNFKEKICYNHIRQNRQGRPEAFRELIYLSTLLSYLVDRSKQGYAFGDNDWIEFKKAVITTKLMYEPEYLKSEEKAVYHQSLHIVDLLKRDAQRKIEKAKIELYNDFRNSQIYDSDLAIYFLWAKKKANEEMEKAQKQLNKAGKRVERAGKELPEFPEPGPWTRLTTFLEADLKALKNEWGEAVKTNLAKEDKAKRADQGRGKKSMRNTKSNMDGEPWLERMDKYFRKYQAIVPHEDTSFTQALFSDCFDTGLTPWALLKASALFSLYRRSSESTRFPWFMAGRQLACLKAYAIASEEGLPHVMAPHMYAMARPDAAFVKRRKALQSAPNWDENCSIANADEMDDWEE